MPNTHVQAEDVVAVHSRVSWGAIFAGAFVALVVYFLLNLLGAALGLSISNRVENDTLGIAASIYAIVATVVALFIGGYITSQCSVGETKSEAVIYGVILWGLMFGTLLWFMASGVRMGINAMMGMASVETNDGRTVVSQVDLDRAAEKAGLNDEQKDKVRDAINNPRENLSQVANDPETRRVAMQAAWWAVAGTVLSLFAAVGGAIVGSGPTPILVVPGLTVRSTRTRIIESTPHTPV
jgi:hypothetical protein